MTKRRVTGLVLAAFIALTGHGHKATKLYDCEDRLVNHCVTFDEGQWREVTSYNPYRFTALHVCKPWGKLPCVVTHKVHEKYVVIH